MNLSQLRTAVDRRTGIAIDALAALELINEANRAIAADQDWPWLARSTTFATVVGTDTYSAASAIPADWLRTIGLKIADDEPMRWRSRNDLDAEWPSATSGRPREYTFDASAIVLRPVPDSVVTVTHRYYRMEPELAGDTDVPSLPALFHPAIVEYSAHLVLRRAREAERAAECLASFERWRNRMLDDARRHAGPAKVRLRRRR